MGTPNHLFFPVDNKQFWMILGYPYFWTNPCMCICQEKLDFTIEGRYQPAKTCGLNHPKWCGVMSKHGNVKNEKCLEQDQTGIRWDG